MKSLEDQAAELWKMLEEKEAEIAELWQKMENEERAGERPESSARAFIDRDDLPGRGHEGRDVGRSLIASIYADPLRDGSGWAVCSVHTISGEHCPETAVFPLEWNGERLALCPDCMDAVRAGAYGPELQAAAVATGEEEPPAGVGYGYDLGLWGNEEGAEEETPETAAPVRGMWGEMDLDLRLYPDLPTSGRSVTIWTDLPDETNETPAQPENKAGDQWKAEIGRSPSGRRIQRIAVNPTAERLEIPARVDWDPVYKIAKAGLTESGWGDGTTRATVVHIQLNGRFVGRGGRLVREDLDLLCGAGPGSFGTAPINISEQIRRALYKNPAGCLCKGCLKRARAQGWIVKGKKGGGHG